MSLHYTNGLSESGYFYPSINAVLHREERQDLLRQYYTKFVRFLSSIPLVMYAWNYYWGDYWFRSFGLTSTGSTFVCLSMKC